MISFDDIEEIKKKGPKFCPICHCRLQPYDLKKLPPFLKLDEAVVFYCGLCGYFEYITIENGKWDVFAGHYGGAPFLLKE